MSQKTTLTDNPVSVGLLAVSNSVYRPGVLAAVAAVFATVAIAFSDSGTVAGDDS